MYHLSSTLDHHNLHPPHTISTHQRIPAAWICRVDVFEIQWRWEGGCRKGAERTKVRCRV